MNAVKNMRAIQAGQEATQYFFPENYLIRTFQNALRHKKNIKVGSHSLGYIIFLGARKEYFTDSDDLESLLCLPENDLSILPLAAKDVPSADRVGRCVTELMWKVTFYLSSGRLMEGYHLHDVVQLSGWPNLTRLPITANTFRIMAFFSYRPTSVFFAARLLKVPQAEMNQVYSASRAAGYIKSINLPDNEPEIPPHRSRTFLSSLLKKIAGR